VIAAAPQPFEERVDGLPEGLDDGRVEQRFLGAKLVKMRFSTTPPSVEICLVVAPRSRARRSTCGRRPESATAPPQSP